MVLMAFLVSLAGGCVFDNTQGSNGPRGGRKKTKQKRTYVLCLAKIELLYTYDNVIFLIAFLSSPYRETPKNALKKIGEGKKQ
jgi:hypothetical protein